MSPFRLLSSVVVIAVFASCNKTNSTVLMRVQPEMPGARCATGGIAVQSGIDADGSGAIEDGEVSADLTRYVCNGTSGTNGMNGTDGMNGTSGDAGANGFNALSQVTAEAAGANCVYGGTRVDVGLDLDGNGALATAEITSTRYICDRASIDSIYFGDLEIRDADDLAQLDDIQVLVGDLTLSNVPTGQLSLPDLRIISGTLRTGFFSQGGSQVPEAPEPLTSVSLPELTRVDTIDFIYVFDLTTLSMPKLQRARRVDISYSGLTALAFPELVRSNDIDLDYNDELVSISMPKLRSAEYFSIASNSALTSVTLTALREVEPYFEIAYNDALSHCAVFGILNQLPVRPQSVFIDSNDTTPVCTLGQVCNTVNVTGIPGSILSCAQSLSFSDARTRCTTAGTGAQLLWLTSSAELTALRAALTAGQVRTGWIGYSDAVTEGVWANFAGSTFDLTAETGFWDQGSTPEPNGGVSENGLEILQTGFGNDLVVSDLRNFICRVP